MAEQTQTEPVDTTPIGTAVPHGDSPAGLPLPLWELHGVESWAKALLAALLDASSRPAQSAPGQPPDPVLVPQGAVHLDVPFVATRLEDGRIGVAATLKQAAPGGRVAYVHHLLKLDILASEIPPFEKPRSEQT